MSTVSAPDDLNLSKRKSTSDSVRAQSDIQIKVSSRQKRFTEKGKSYLKELRGRDREKAYQEVKTQIEKIRNLCDEPETELEALEKQRDKLDSLKDKFNEAHL